MSLPADIVKGLTSNPAIMQLVVDFLRDVFAGRSAEKSAARLTAVAAGKEAIRAPYRRAKK